MGNKRVSKLYWDSRLVGRKQQEILRFHDPRIEGWVVYEGKPGTKIKNKEEIEYMFRRGMEMGLRMSTAITTEAYNKYEIPKTES